MQSDLGCHRSPLYNYLGVSSIVVANEGKASGSPSSSFTGNVDIAYIPVLLKQRLQVLQRDRNDTLRLKWVTWVYILTKAEGEGVGKIRSF